MPPRLRLLIWLPPCQALLMVGGYLAGSALANSTGTGDVPGWLQPVSASTPGPTVLHGCLLIAGAGVVVLSARLGADDRARWLYAAFVLGAIAAAVMGLREYAEHWRAGDTSWRAFGSFGNPNFLAGYLAPALPIALTVALVTLPGFRPGLWTLLAGLVAAIVAGGLLVTGSRGGILCGGLGIAVFLGALLLSPTLRRGSPWSRLITVGVLLGVTAVGLRGVLVARQSASTALPQIQGLCTEEGGSAADDSNSFRRFTWQGTLKMAAARPVLGWGAGSFESSFGPFQQAAYTRHAHQGYLQILAEQGIFGAAIWLALLAAGTVGWIRKTLRGDMLGPGALGALAAIFGHNLFDSTWAVWAILAMTWGLVGLGIAELIPSRAGGPNQGKSNPGRPAAFGAARWAIPVALTALLSWHACGRSLFEQGRAELAAGEQGALAPLQTAATMLPLDYRVQDLLRLALLGAGRPADALEAARASVRLSPMRAAGYYFLGQLLQSGMGGRETTIRAQLTYELGLQRVPSDVQLRYALAQAQQSLGEIAEAEKTYRAIAEIEVSPVVRVRALTEMRDYRLARARLELARFADQAGRPEEALMHRKRAACTLAARRRLFDGATVNYIVTGDYQPGLENQLRAEEQRLWRFLAQTYRQRGERRMATFCDDEYDSVEKSWEKLRLMQVESE